MNLLAWAVLIFGCTSSTEPTDDADAAADAAEVADEGEGAKTAATKPEQPAPAPEGNKEGPLYDPSLANEKAPDEFRVKFETTKGDFVIKVTRAWSPVGADRFYNLVKIGYYDDVGFFRTIPKFMGQFGIHGDPAVNRAWRPAQIDDDPVKETNSRGRITFAKTNAPNSRTTQLFINFRDNANLDRMGFSPFGEVVEGMDVVDTLHMTGEGYPGGPGPSQGQLQAQGNEYLKAEFPDVDFIKSAKVIEG